MYDSFVRQLNYCGFRKALRNTNRYVVMDRSIESPDDFRFLNRYIPSHALRPAADPIREVKARTVAREKLDATAPPASLDEAVLATETAERAEADLRPLGRTEKAAARQLLLQEARAHADAARWRHPSERRGPAAEAVRGGGDGAHGAQPRLVLPPL